MNNQRLNICWEYVNRTQSLNKGLLIFLNGIPVIAGRISTHVFWCDKNASPPMVQLHQVLSWLADSPRSKNFFCSARAESLHSQCISLQSRSFFHLLSEPFCGLPQSILVSLRDQSVIITTRLSVDSPARNYKVRAAINQGYADQCW